MLRNGGQREEAQVGQSFEKAVEPDRTRARSQVEEIADEQSCQLERNLRIAVLGFNRQVRYVLGRGAEGCGHPGVVEMASITQKMRRSLHCEIGAPFDSSDRKSPVLVHDPRGERGRG